MPNSEEIKKKITYTITINLENLIEDYFASEKIKGIVNDIQQFYYDSDEKESKLPVRAILFPKDNGFSVRFELLDTKNQWESFYLTKIDNQEEVTMILNLMQATLFNNFYLADSLYELIEN